LEQAGREEPLDRSVKEVHQDHPDPMVSRVQ